MEPIEIHGFSISETLSDAGGNLGDEMDQIQAKASVVRVMMAETAYICTASISVISTSRAGEEIEGPVRS